MSDVLDRLMDLVLGLQRDLAEVNVRLRNTVRTGTIAERDAVKGYRVDWGKDADGKTILSPWYPHPEAGGDHKSWEPLTVGQIVTALNPGGDPRQGFLVRGGFSDRFAQPSSSLDETVRSLHGGKLKETVTSSGRKVEITGDESLTATGSLVISAAGGHLA